MANFIQLLGLPQVRRVDTPELLAASTQDTDGDAKTAAIAQANDSTARLQLSLNLVDAIAGRIKLFPPLPSPISLQDLVRSGRARLLSERQSADRDTITQRQTAVATVLKVLQT